MQQVTITLIRYNPCYKINIQSHTLHSVGIHCMRRDDSMEYTRQPRESRNQNKNPKTANKKNHSSSCSTQVTVQWCSWKGEKAQWPLANPPRLLIINHLHKTLWTIWHTEDKSENMSDGPAVPCCHIQLWISGSSVIPMYPMYTHWRPVKFTSLGLTWPGRPRRFLSEETVSSAHWRMLVCLVKIMSKLSKHFISIFVWLSSKVIQIPHQYPCNRS